MQKEVWKDIPGYEGFYMASTKGNIKSIDRVVKNRMYIGIILSQKKNKYGYKSVCLTNGVTRKTRLVHQLVASTFLGYNGYTLTTVIDHIDNDKSNNCKSNLHIITKRENNIKERKRTSRSKFLGVSFESRRNKWRSDVRVDNKKKYLGSFDKEADAIKAILNYNKLKKIKL